MSSVVFCFHWTIFICQIHWTTCYSNWSICVYSVRMMMLIQLIRIILFFLALSLLFISVSIVIYMFVHNNVFFVTDSQFPIWKRYKCWCYKCWTMNFWIGDNKSYLSNLLSFIHKFRIRVYDLHFHCSRVLYIFVWKHYRYSEMKYE